MKYIILINLILLGGALTKAQSTYDNFDEYTAGSPLCVESEGLWTTIDDNPGGIRDAFISNEIAYSASNSVVFTRSSSNVLLPLNNVRSGSWELTFKMWVASGGNGNFSVSHEPVNGQINTAFEATFTEAGRGILNAADAVTYDFTHPVGEWFDVKVVIRPEQNQARLLIDEIPIRIGSWAWCLGSLGIDSTITALHFNPQAPESGEIKYYIDDVGFQQTNLQLEEHVSSIRVYPIPASHQVIIEVPSAQIVGCEIYSTIGKLVHKTTVASEQLAIDCSSWKPGIYLTKLESSNKKVWHTKFIIE